MRGLDLRGPIAASVVIKLRIASVMHSNVPIQQPRQLSHSICGRFARPISDQACTIHLIAGLREARLLRLPKFQVVQQARSHGCVRVHASDSLESSHAGASSLLKLSIPFATEFGDSVAVTTSASNWSVEEVSDRRSQYTMAAFGHGITM